jgi:MFS family permease
VSAPGGGLFDRWRRRRSLALGWFFYAVAYALFAFATTPIRFAIALLVYGTYYALTEGAQNALVAAFVPREHLGRAYGVYALVVGLLAIPASASFGWLFRYADGRYAFLAAAAVALVASLAMTRLVPPREPHAERVS